MGEFKDQDKNQTGKQVDEAAFGQFDKDRQQEQGETKKQDEFADTGQQDEQFRKDEGFDKS